MEDYILLAVLIGIFILISYLINLGMIKEKMIMKEQDKVEKYYLNHYGFNCPYFDFGKLLFKHSAFLAHSEKEGLWYVYKCNGGEKVCAEHTLSLIYWQLKLN